MVLNLGDDDDSNDDGDPNIGLEQCALNEVYQTLIESPLVINRAELEENVARVHKQCMERWAQVKDNVHDYGSEPGKMHLVGNQVYIKKCSTQRHEKEFYEDYSHSAKLAGHTLKGFTAIANSYVPGLHIPYACLVDYKGYRWLIMSLIPIRRPPINTKKYRAEQLNEFIVLHKRIIEKAQKGLQEAQVAQNSQRIKDFEQKIAELQEKISKEPERRAAMEKCVGKAIAELPNRLGLAHMHEDDLKVYEGNDGRVYLLGVSQIMPPERSNGFPGHHQRLRLEFVRRMIHSKYDTKGATEQLQTRVVLEAAHYFLESDEHDATALKRFMHQHGINLRYMGRFLYLLRQRTDFTAKILPSEMVARAYTHIINRNMRDFRIDMICKARCISILRTIETCREGEYPKELQNQFRIMYLPHLLEKEALETSLLFEDSQASYWSNIIRDNADVIVNRIIDMSGITFQHVAGKRQIQFHQVEKRTSVFSVAQNHLANGDYQSAKLFYKAEQDLKINMLGPLHLHMAVNWIYLADVHVRAHQIILAEAYLDKAINIYKVMLNCEEHEPQQHSTSFGHHTHPYAITYDPSHLHTAPTKGLPPPQSLDVTTKRPPPPQSHGATSKGPPPPQSDGATCKGPPPPQAHGATSKGPPPPQSLGATSKRPPPPQAHGATSKGPPPPQPRDVTTKEPPPPPQLRDAISKDPPSLPPHDTANMSLERMNVWLAYAVAIERKAMLLSQNPMHYNVVQNLLKSAQSARKHVDNQFETAINFSWQAWLDYYSGLYPNAIAKYLEAIKILRSEINSTTSNRTRQNQAITVFNAALCLRKNGNVALALLFCKTARSLVIGHDTSNLDKSIVASIEDTIAWIHDAEDQQEKLLRSAPRVRNSGPLCEISSSKRKANKSFQRALQYRREVYGEYHYLYAFSLDHVAHMLVERQEYSLAFSYYEKALTILRHCLGRDHVSVGILLHNIALFFAHQNKRERALNAYNASFKILSTYYPDRAYNCPVFCNLVSEGHLSFLTHEEVLPPILQDPASFLLKENQYASNFVYSLPQQMRDAEMLDGVIVHCEDMLSKIDKTTMKQKWTLPRTGTPPPSKLEETEESSPFFSRRHSLSDNIDVIKAIGTEFEFRSSGKYIHN